MMTMELSRAMECLGLDYAKAANPHPTMLCRTATVLVEDVYVRRTIAPGLHILASMTIVTEGWAETPNPFRVVVYSEDGSLRLGLMR